MRLNQYAVDHVGKLISDLYPKIVKLQELADKLETPNDPAGYDKVEGYGVWPSQRYRDAMLAGIIIEKIDTIVRKYVAEDTKDH